jgi:hypothetical protein
VTAAIYDQEPADLTDGRSPFYWGFSYPFPQIIAAKFRNAQVTRSERTFGPYLTDFVVYSLRYDGGFCQQLEIAYDSTAGNVPRFARRIDFGPGINAIIKEMYLNRAMPCKRGGFVPTDWFDSVYIINDFSIKHPDYKGGDDFKPEESLGSHFVATNFRDRTANVALQDVADVGVLAGIGGTVSIKPGTKQLTMATIKSTLGRKMTEAQRPFMPAIDLTEKHQFDDDGRNSNQFVQRFFGSPISKSGLGWYVGGIGVVLTIAFGKYLRRKKRTLIILALAVSLPSGCKPITKPIAKISAAFKDGRVITDPADKEFRLDLIMRNDGNVPLTINSVNGGCSCRRVDQSKFPLAITPGGLQSVDVSLAVGRYSSASDFRFEFDTNRGMLYAPVSCLMLVRHQFDPDSLMFNLLETADLDFELKHIMIWRGIENRPSVSLRLPSPFEVQKISSESHPVGAAPEFMSEQTVYRITRPKRDELNGIHREVIQLVNEQETALREIPLVWRRRSFVSSSPERVALSDRPVRVFLSCDDDNVELTRVVSAPNGIKAIVSSPKEITVSLDRSATDQVDGLVVVETNAASRESLKVPVQRYHGAGEKKSASRE